VIFIAVLSQIVSKRRDSILMTSRPLSSKCYSIHPTRVALS